MPKVNEILIIVVNSHICKRSPSSLDFLSGYLVLSFHFNLLLALEITSPGPLNLNGSNVIHCGSMILKKSSRQAHFVCGLNYCCTKVTETLIFIFMHHVERRGQKLLAKFLSCS